MNAVASLDIFKKKFFQWADSKSLTGVVNINIRNSRKSFLRLIVQIVIIIISWYKNLNLNGLLLFVPTGEIRSDIQEDYEETNFENDAQKSIYSSTQYFHLEKNDSDHPKIVYFSIQGAGKLQCTSQNEVFYIDITEGGLENSIQIIGNQQINNFEELLNILNAIPGTYFDSYRPPTCLLKEPLNQPY